MFVLDYGVVYIHASLQCLYMLDTVYHGALRFITNLKALVFAPRTFPKVCTELGKRAFKYAALSAIIPG